MKKWMIPVLATLCCVSITACGDSSSASTEPTAVTTAASTEAGTTTTADAQTTKAPADTTTTATTTASDESGANQSAELTEDGIRTLMKGNIDCITNIFFSNDLPTQGDPIREHVYQVDTTKFASYADLESYLHTIYCKETVNMLLNDYPYEGQPKYLNIDGKLCFDETRSSAKGYFVDWSSYTVKITKSDASTCEFTVTAKVTEPSDTPVYEDYNVECKAIKEDGKWVLSNRVV